MTLRFYFQLTKTVFRAWAEFLANNCVTVALRPAWREAFLGAGALLFGFHVVYCAFQIYV